MSDSISAPLRLIHHTKQASLGRSGILKISRGAAKGLAVDISYRCGEVDIAIVIPK